MSHARAKIYARLIKCGKRTLAALPEDDREAVREAYMELFGENLSEE